MESESLESKETARKKIVTDYFSYPITLAEIFKNDKEGIWLSNISPVCISNYTNVDMIKRRLFDIPYSTEVPAIHQALEIN